MFFFALFWFFWQRFLMLHIARGGDKLDPPLKTMPCGQNFSQVADQFLYKTLSLLEAMNQPPKPQPRTHARVSGPHCNALHLHPPGPCQAQGPGLFAKVWGMHPSRPRVNSATIMQQHSQCVTAMQPPSSQQRKLFFSIHFFLARAYLVCYPLFQIALVLTIKIFGHG